WADQDYELSTLMAKESTERGRRLTPEEETQNAVLAKRIAELESQLAAKDKALTPPPATKRVTRIVEALKPRYEAALERQRAKVGRVSAGIDPTDFKDWAEIGAYHLARGIEKTAEWTQAMLDDLGETIRPHLDAIREQAEKLRSAAISE